MGQVSKTAFSIPVEQVAVVTCQRGVTAAIPPLPFPPQITIIFFFSYPLTSVLQALAGLLARRRRTDGTDEIATPYQKFLLVEAYGAEMEYQFKRQDKAALQVPFTASLASSIQTPRCSFFFLSCDAATMVAHTCGRRKHS
jgi:hypothetical protein